MVFLPTDDRDTMQSALNRAVASFRTMVLCSLYAEHGGATEAFESALLDLVQNEMADGLETMNQCFVDCYRNEVAGIRCDVFGHRFQCIFTKDKTRICTYALYYPGENVQICVPTEPPSVIAMGTPKPKTAETPAVTPTGIPASTPRGMATATPALTQAPTATARPTPTPFVSPTAHPADGGTPWQCSACDQSDNRGNFCTNCGQARPEDNSWVCPDCGSRNNGRFCTNCGAKKPEPVRYCPNCGTKITEGMRFCAECGTKVVTD